MSDDRDQLIEKAREAIGGAAFETSIRTADGEDIVLFHDRPITEDEKAEFESLTVKEIKLLSALWEFEEKQL